MVQFRPWPPPFLPSVEREFLAWHKLESVCNLCAHDALIRVSVVQFRPWPPLSFHALRLAFGLAFLHFEGRYTESPGVGIDANRETGGREPKKRLAGYSGEKVLRTFS